MVRPLVCSAVCMITSMGRQKTNIVIDFRALSQPVSRTIHQPFSPSCEQCQQHQERKNYSNKHFLGTPTLEGSLLPHVYRPSCVPSHSPSSFPTPPTTQNDPWAHKKAPKMRAENQTTWVQFSIWSLAAVGLQANYLTRLSLLFSSVKWEKTVCTPHLRWKT